MEYNEDSYLMLSGIQHFAFCRRQWALIHIDGMWEDNELTVEGKLLHENAHNTYRSESRGDVIISRAMPIFSRTLGLSGECDVVEFRRNATNGISVNGHQGLYTVYPVEYKRGSPKENLCDILQLTAQVMCLEEMLLCEIPEAALYYFETKHRLKVNITDELKENVRKYSEEMHTYYERQYLPRPKRKKGCNSCSHKDKCLPKLEKIMSAKTYNDENLGRIDS